MAGMETWMQEKDKTSIKENTEAQEHWRRNRAEQCKSLELGSYRSTAVAAKYLTQLYILTNTHIAELKSELL